MNEKKVYSNIQERIALDNYKIERKRNRKIRKWSIIAASAATAIVAGIFTARTLIKKD